MQPLRVLIVDDLRDTADALALLLKLWGHEVTAAYDSWHALEAAAARPFDVVLLDLGLPGRMDGCALARQLRQLPGMRECLLAAVTGYGQESDVQRCKEAGMDWYLLKPIDPTDLEKLLDREAMWLRRGTSG